MVKVQKSLWRSKKVFFVLVLVVKLWFKIFKCSRIFHLLIHKKVFQSNNQLYHLTKLITFTQGWDGLICTASPHKNILKNLNEVPQSQDFVNREKMIHLGLIFRIISDALFYFQVQGTRKVDHAILQHLMVKVQKSLWRSKKYFLV